jgi:hypothetical protein
MRDLETLAAELNARGFPATVEHPGYVDVPLGGDLGYLACGFGDDTAIAADLMSADGARVRHTVLAFDVDGLAREIQNLRAAAASGAL